MFVLTAGCQWHLFTHVAAVNPIPYTSQSLRLWMGHCLSLLHDVCGNLELDLSTQHLQGSA